MLKIILIGLVAVFLAMVAGSARREYGYLVAVAACLLIFFYGISQVSIMADELRKFEEAIGLQHEYLAILLKMSGIAYLSQFAVSLCRDAGQGAIASQIGFAGKISMIIISIPILEALIKMIGDFFA